MTSRERKWIQSIQQGDKQACQAFVSRYLPSLYAFFQGMGLSSPLSEDLAQETFLELWKSLGSFRGDSSLKTWVFVIGRRVAWRQIKRHAQQSSHELYEDESVAVEDGREPQDELLWKREQKARLQACVHALDAPFREILLLHYMEDLSIREMALILEIAEGTAKSRLHRALSRLRTSLDTQWQ